MSEETFTVEEGINAVWILTCTGLVFFMQCGFTLIECGGVRSKNIAHTLILNLFDGITGFIVFWLVGYGLAFGNVKNFAGGDKRYFATSGNMDGYLSDPFLHFAFQFSFCSTSATLVSGSLTERAKVPAYIGFSALVSGIIYPIVAAWCWGNGWLMQRGYHDFSGSGVIHLVGGTAGFVGAYFLGPRIGRFKDKNSTNKQKDEELGSDKDQEGTDEQENQQEIIDFTKGDIKKVLDCIDQKHHENLKFYIQNLKDEIKPQSYPLIVIGTFILWFTWLFFNGGSTYSIFVPFANNSAKIFTNTILAGSVGGMVGVFVKPHIMGTYNFVNQYDVGALCNGIVCALVSIYANCDRTEPWAAFIIGGIAAILHCLAAKLI